MNCTASLQKVNFTGNFAELFVSWLKFAPTDTSIIL